MEFPSLRVDGRVALVRLPRNRGKGAAVREGMLRTNGAQALFMDADMATPPSELPKLVAALETADVALGSRIQPDGSDMRASQPRYRRPDRESSAGQR